MDGGKNYGKWIEQHSNMADVSAHQINRITTNDLLATAGLSTDSPSDNIGKYYTCSCGSVFDLQLDKEIVEVALVTG